MSRLHFILVVAAALFSTALVALASALTTHDSRDARAAPEAAVATPAQPSTRWPEPRAPFDETPITPVESAGAPQVV